MKKFPKQLQKGFTLIEVMVSVTIFMIVMTIVLGALLAIIDGNRKTLAINSVSNNLGSAIESMIRDLKTGYGYRCGLPIQTVITGNELSAVCNPSNPETSIAFISTITGTPRSVQYWITDPDPTTGRRGIMKYYCPANATDCSTSANYESLIITSPDVDIKQMEFYTNVPSRGLDQPSVFMVIKGTAYVNKTQFSDFSIQTFVSQRLLNI